MKHYTGTISATFAEKLKEKGMPMMECYNITPSNSFSDDDGVRFYYLPTFGACFDWLMSNRRITIVVEPSFYEQYLSKIYNKDRFVKGFDGNTWHEAANAAIEKALTLI